MTVVPGVEPSASTACIRQCGAREDDCASGCFGKLHKSWVDGISTVRRKLCEDPIMDGELVEYRTWAGLEPWPLVLTSDERHASSAARAAMPNTISRVGPP